MGLFNVAQVTGLIRWLQISALVLSGQQTIVSSGVSRVQHQGGEDGGRATVMKICNEILVFLLLFGTFQCSTGHWLNKMVTNISAGAFWASTVVKWWS